MANSKNLIQTDWDFVGSSLAELQTAALLEIAINTSVMAKEYNKLLSDNQAYKKWHEERGRHINKLYRQNAGLKGQITKLKKKLNGNH